MGNLEAKRYFNHTHDFVVFVRMLKNSHYYLLCACNIIKQTISSSIRNIITGIGCLNRTPVQVSKAAQTVLDL